VGISVLLALRFGQFSLFVVFNDCPILGNDGGRCKLYSDEQIYNYYTYEPKRITMLCLERDGESVNVDPLSLLKMELERKSFLSTQLFFSSVSSQRRTQPVDIRNGSFCNNNLDRFRSSLYYATFQFGYTPFQNKFDSKIFQ
jgi:hypothetical protein